MAAIFAFGASKFVKADIVPMCPTSNQVIVDKNATAITTAFVNVKWAIIWSSVYYRERRIDFGWRSAD